MKKLVLVLNCGSSSIKFAVIEPQAEATLFSGLAQCIGAADASLRYTKGEQKETRALPNIDYRAALKKIMDLIDADTEIHTGIVAVGHRVVHGGEKFTCSAIIDDEILAAIKACNNLAPLHNPANIIGIEEAKQAFPEHPHIAVFDTAFHQTMPRHVYIYPIPYAFYEKERIRRYGFHGTSHRFVSQKAADILGLDLRKTAFITAHLGNGCSATAVLNGKSIDTTMGLTPLEGLVMGTRSGDVDPGLFSHLTKNFGYDAHTITEMLNKKSGLLGISQKYSDMRGIEEAMQQGDDLSTLAFEIFCYRLAQYIASLSVPLGRIDALIFTGGIGENSPLVRARTLGWLKIFNFNIDEGRNHVHGKNSKGIITQVGSAIAMVVPTNEELLIAQDALFLAR